MKKVVVIGGGIAGLCSAYSLAKEGFQVTILDSAPQEFAGCSHGNAGMIVPSHFVPLAAPGMVGYGLRMMSKPGSPFAIHFPPSGELVSWCLKFMAACRPERAKAAEPVLAALGMASRELHAQLAQELGNPQNIALNGLVMACRHEHTLADEASLVPRANAFGMDAEVLDTQRLKNLIPYASTNLAGGVFFPKDGHLTPQHLISALRNRLEELGVEQHFGVEVSGFQLNQDRIEAAIGNRKAFEADEFVLAGGVGSARLAQSIDIQLPMVGGKGYSYDLAIPRPSTEPCAILIEARVAVTPMGDSLRIAGAMELGGTPDGVVRPRLDAIATAVMHDLPGLASEPTGPDSVWTGLRPCSPDGLPYLGRTKQYANLVVATGHAMMGLSLGPVTGQTVADLVAGRTQELSPLLSPDRYA